MKIEVFDACCAPVTAAVLDEPAAEELASVYSPILEHGMPYVVVDLATAQLVKNAANAFLATKISFINAMAELCEATGADVVALADAIGHDARIGRRFLHAGLGFGGGCLPKDIRAFAARAEELGAGEAVSFLHVVDAINNRRRATMVELARVNVGGAFAGRTVAVLGDMAELGPEAPRYHAEIGEAAAEVDIVVGVGELARGYRPDEWVATAADAVEIVTADAVEQRLLLSLGARETQEPFCVGELLGQEPVLGREAGQPGEGVTGQPRRMALPRARMFPKLRPACASSAGWRRRCWCPGRRRRAGRRRRTPRRTGGPSPRFAWSSP